MGFGLSLGLGLSSIILFFLFMLLSMNAYKKRWNRKYDIRNTFPYELNYQQRFTDNILPNAILTMAVATSIALFAFFDIRHLSGAAIVTVACGCLASIIIFFMFFLDIRFIRFHIVMFALLAVASFGCPASIAIICYSKYQATLNIYYIVICSLSIAAALFGFGLIMNPKLTFRLEMQKAVGEDGKETLIRPKFFVLAISEWFFMFLILASDILLLLAYIPIK